MSVADQQHDRLVIRRELRMIGTVALRDGPLTIGRSPDCDIHLQHEAVSRLHAKLVCESGTWRIVDNGSVNGIRVNGLRVSDSALQNGDVIEVRPFAINYVGAAGQSDQSISLSMPHGESPTVIRARRDAGHAVVRQRLADLYTLARHVIHRKDNGTFWLEVHGMLQRSLTADRCVLVGIDQETGMYRLAPRTRDNDSAPLAVSQSILADVVNTKEGVMIRRVAEDDRYADAHSLVERRTGSVICVPVVVQEATRAVLYAERRENAIPFIEDDLAFVVAAMDMAAAAVEVDELQARATELSRVRGRLDAAREFQEMLLPSPIPQPDWGEVAAINVPADQMSGDIYDVLIDEAGRLSAYIVDVSGKGVPAAFISAILHHALRSALLKIDSLEQVVRRVNETLDSYHMPACFATLILCRWSADGSRVEIANAGHHAPLWVGKGGRVEAFPDRIGLPLGILPEWSGEIADRDAGDDLALLLSSDGATEAKDPQKEELGLEPLGESLKGLTSLGAEAIIEGMLKRIRWHAGTRELDDDVTLVVMKHRC